MDWNGCLSIMQGYLENSPLIVLYNTPRRMDTGNMHHPRKWTVHIAPAPYYGQ